DRFLARVEGDRGRDGEVLGDLLSDRRAHGRNLAAREDRVDLEPVELEDPARLLPKGGRGGPGDGPARRGYELIRGVGGVARVGRRAREQQAEDRVVGERRVGGEV